MSLGADETEGIFKYTYPQVPKLTTKTELPPPPKSISGSSVASVLDRFAVLTGGKDEYGVVNDNAQIFDVVKNVWRSLPRLKAPRNGHGSCSLRSTVYLFAGEGASGEMTNSLDWLPLN